MKIIIDTKFRKKYGEGLNRGKTIVKEIVVHGTAGGRSAQAIIDWMINGERADEYKRGVSSFHYIVDYDGKVYEIIDPVNWVYHSSSGVHDKETIGIELMQKENDNSGAYTDDQYKSLSALIAHIGNKYPEIERVTTHAYNIKKYSNLEKVCPGVRFSFDILKEELIRNGVLSSTITEGIAI